MDIGDYLVVVSCDRLCRMADFTAAGFFVAFVDKSTGFFARKDVRVASRADVERLVQRERMSTLLPEERVDSALQALVRESRRSTIESVVEAMNKNADVLDKFLRDEE